MKLKSLPDVSEMHEIGGLRPFAAYYNFVIRGSAIFNFLKTMTH